MREDMLHGTGSKTAEVLDAARGAVLFAAVVAAMAIVVGLAGWAAGSYTPAAIVLGCGVLAAIGTTAMWGVLHWGVDDVEFTPRTERVESTAPSGFERAA